MTRIRKGIFGDTSVLGFNKKKAPLLDRRGAAGFAEAGW